MKKTYMQPATQVMKIQQQNIICGTNRGLNDTLQGGSTVTSAWGREGGGWDDEF